VIIHQLDTIGGQFDWLAYENPYDLSAEHRAILVYKYWQESVNGACERLTRMKAEYDIVLQDTEQVGERRKLAVLQKAKIIGMTTTVRYDTLLMCTRGYQMLLEFMPGRTNFAVQSVINSQHKNPR